MATRMSVMACAVVGVTAVLLSGCGGKSSDGAADKASTTPTASTSTSTPAATTSTTATAADLEAYVAAGRAQMKSLVKGFNGLYTSIDVKAVPPSGIEYVYVLAKPVDLTKAAKALDAQVPTLQSTFDTQVAPEMEQHGFANPSATWTYLNPDKLVVWTHTFEKSS